MHEKWTETVWGNETISPKEVMLFMFLYDFWVSYTVVYVDRDGSQLRRNLKTKKNEIVLKWKNIEQWNEPLYQYQRITT